MTREQRLNDAFMSGVATALCAEFIEVSEIHRRRRSLRGAPCYGHLADAVIRELGVPLVTGDIPGVAVILGAAPTVEEGVALVKILSVPGYPGDPGGRNHRPGAQRPACKTGANVRVIPLGKDVTSVIHVVSVAVCVRP